MSNCEEIVHDGELIVRGGLERYHYDLGKRRLVKQAFHLTYERTTLSVIRAQGCSADRCKDIARTYVANPNATKPRIYCGLITLRAGCIRCGEATVSIVPGDYPEHACIDFGVKRQKNEGLDTVADVLQYNKVLDHLFASARYFHDPSPEEPQWKGEALNYKLCAQCVSKEGAASALLGNQ